MRAGKVARGGIRWSDRKEDFRTEILGLMKAQTVKNAVIVPVGSKGGFVVKQPPASREAFAAEGIECYKILIRGLLDLTDNIVADGAGGSDIVPSCRRRMSCGMTATTPIWSSPPTRAPRRSPTSPTRSPRNTASGSATPLPRAARPATTTRRWASPRAAPGSSSSAISASSDAISRPADFTVVGVGDMSGDVFGNGMLMSRHTQAARRLQPSAHLCRSRSRSGGELCRAASGCSDLPRSSWADYDPALISPGGGVFRAQRQIGPDQRRR